MTARYTERAQAVRPPDRQLPGGAPARRRRVHQRRGDATHRAAGRVPARREPARDARGLGREDLGGRRRQPRDLRRAAPARRHRHGPRLPAAPLVHLDEADRAHARLGRAPPGADRRRAGGDAASDASRRIRSIRRSARREKLTAWNHESASSPWACPTCSARPASIATGSACPRTPATRTSRFFKLRGTWLSLYPREALAEDALVPAEGSGFRGFTLAHNVASKAEVDRTARRSGARGREAAEARRRTSSGAATRATSRIPTASCGKSPGTRTSSSSSQLERVLAHHAADLVRA